MNLETRFGVVLHEMCHVLYDEQSANFQNELDSMFRKNTSIYSKLANTYFDEGLATAIGNGYTYAKLNNKYDTSEWYNNEYINCFAKAMYPMANRYLDAGKTLDQQYVDSSIILFEKTFPKSPYDFGILFMSASIYCDAQTDQEREKLISTIQRKFQMYSIRTSSPISDPESISELKNGEGSQIIVIDQDQKKNFELILLQFPEIKSKIAGKNDANFILNFFDSSNRPIVIIYLESEKRMVDAVKKLKDLNYLDSENGYILF